MGVLSTEHTAQSTEYSAQERIKERKKEKGKRTKLKEVEVG
jgi:hypothetical protein